MPLSFTCPACGHDLQAPDVAAGKKGDCRFCKAAIVAPAVSGGPATLAPPKAPVDDGPPSPNAALPPPPPGSGAYAPPHPGYPPPGYTGPESGLSDDRPAPPRDLLENPNISKAFMSRGLPAVADFWRRVLAFGIDLILITAMQAGLAAVMLSSRDYHTTNVFLATSRQMGAAMQFTLTLFAAKVLYGAILEGSPLQATVGKAVLGMKVCTEPGDRVTFLNALWRNFCKWATLAVVGFVPIIGYFPYVIFYYATQNNLLQTLHDMVAGTVVAERNW